MRIVKIITLVLAGVFTTQIASAQNLSKVEKKRLKKEIKRYKKDPAQYKKMKTRNKEEIAQRDETIGELTKRLDEQNDEMRALRDSFIVLSKKYNNLKAKGSTEIPEGTVYAVQIGFFKLLQLDEFNSRVRTIRAENQDGGKRYVIGYFRDLESAKQFNEEIKTIGIDDAFVSQYINGTRNREFDAQEVE